MGKHVDLTGKRYDRLLVLAKTEKRSSSGCVMWLCRCDCGKVKNVSGQSLTSSNTRSCGCLSKEHAAKLNSVELSGKVFGYLTAVEKTEFRTKSGGHVIWRCLCSCGKETLVGSSFLINGNTQSCGCLLQEKNSQNARKMFTTHGQSKTKAYACLLAHRRRERVRGVDNDWSVMYEFYLRSFFCECVVCGATKHLSTDHVLPLSKGYGLKPGNAVRLCKSCNSKKYTKDIDQLPVEWQSKILSAAEDFRLAMSGGF